MKTKLRRISKRSLAVFLGVMMLVTSIGFGSLITVNSVISNITATVSGFSAHSSSTFPLNFTESLTKDTRYGIRINFSENGDHYCKAKDRNDIDVGTAKELGWGNGSATGDSGMSWFQATKTGTFSFSIYTSGGKNYVKVEEKPDPVASSVTLSASPNNTTINAGTSISFTATASGVQSGATYTFYVDGTSKQSTTSNTYTYNFPTAGTHKVKVKVSKSDYSDVESSELTYTVNATTTLYIKKTLHSSFEKAYLWSGSTKWTGAWSGEDYSTWNDAGNYYYKAFTNSCSNFQVILNTNGDSYKTSDSAAYDTGKTYKIDSASQSSAVTLTEFTPETTYAVTVESENTSKGTVNAATVNAGETTPVTIPTAVPAYGYKFKQWVATSPATIVANSTSASTATVKSTGAGGKVTAQFEPDDNMNLYIAGRFHINNNGTPVNSFDSGDWSNTGGENIPFTYDSNAQKYKVETNYGLNDLSNEISNLDPNFFIYDKNSSKHYWYYNNTAVGLTYANKGTQYQLTGYENTNDSINTRLRFKSSTNESPVTIWFDATTQKFSFTVPEYHNITFTNQVMVNNVKVGEIKVNDSTTSPQRIKEEASYTINLKPENGYDIETLDIGSTYYNTKSQLVNAGLTSDGNGGYNFSTTCGNADATITATFKKNDYNVTVESAHGVYEIIKNNSSTTTYIGMGCTAQIGDSLAFKVTANSGWAIKDYTIKSGTGAGTTTSQTDYINNNKTTGASSADRTYTMGYQNLTITVNYVQIVKLTNSTTHSHITTTITYKDMNGDVASIDDGEFGYARYNDDYTPWIHSVADEGYSYTVNYYANGTTTGLDSGVLYDIDDSNPDSNSEHYSGSADAVITISAAEDLETNYVLSGTMTNPQWQHSGTANTSFKRRTGHSDEEIAYLDDLTLPANSSFSFKIVENTSSQTFYSWKNPNNASDNYLFYKDTNNVQLVTDGNDMHIETTVAGKYTFILNMSTKQLSVIFPDQNINYLISDTQDSNPTITPNIDSVLTFDSNYKPTKAKYNGKTDYVTVKVKVNDGFMLHGVTAANVSQTASGDVKPDAPTIDAYPSSSNNYYYTVKFKMGRDHVNLTFDVRKIKLSATTNLSSIPTLVPNTNTTVGSCFTAGFYNAEGTSPVTELTIGQTYTVIAKIDKTVITDYTAYTKNGVTINNNITATFVSESSDSNYYYYKYSFVANRGDASTGYVTAMFNFKPASPVVSAVNEPFKARAGKAFKPYDSHMISIANFGELSSNSKVTYKVTAHNDTNNVLKTSTTFSGSEYKTGSVMAPETSGTYTLQVIVRNQPLGFSGNTSGTSYVQTTYTHDLIVEYDQAKVNFYLDSHSATIESVKIDIKDGNTAGARIYYDNDNNALENLTLNLKSGTSIYYLSKLIPENSNDLYAWITVGGDTSQTKKVKIPNAKLVSAGDDGLDIWLEATTAPRTANGGTPLTTVLTPVEDGMKRLYLCKPAGWSNWTNIMIHWWGESSGTQSTWGNTNQKMKYFGHKGVTGGTKYYYYYDIPKSANYVVFSDNFSNTSKTNNIQLTEKTNFLYLSGTGGTTAEEKTPVDEPKITKYEQNVSINAGTTYKILERANYKGDAQWVSTTNDTDNAIDSVTIDSKGNVVVSAKTIGKATAATATIKLRVKGSIEQKEGFTTDNYDTNRDNIEITINVTVKNPNITSTIQPMSYGSNESTIEINKDNNNYTAVIDSVDTILSINGTSYKSSRTLQCAIVDFSENNHKVKIKYAKLDSTIDSNYAYTSINLTARINSTPVRESGPGGNRYFFDHWEKNGATQQSLKDDSYIDIDGNPYVKFFETYPYTDINIHFEYYDYNTERTVNDKTENYYFYDSNWVDEQYSAVPGSDFQKTHVKKTFDAVYEHTGNELDFDERTYSQVSTYINKAVDAKIRKVNSNYYNFELRKDAAHITNIGNTPNTEKNVDITVRLESVPRTYKVYFHNNQIGSPVYYQQYVKLDYNNVGTYNNDVDGSTLLEWIDHKGSASGTETAVHYGTYYRFRVTKNTYLTATKDFDFANNYTEEGKKSVVTYSDYEISHERVPVANSNPTQYEIKEILEHDFNIVDYFNATMDKYTDGNEEKSHDCSFVGGGVLFYSLDENGKPKDSMIDNQFVDTTNYEISTTENKDAIIDALQELISGNETEVDKLDIRYGTSSAGASVGGVSAGGKSVNSGLGFMYSYLPFYEFNTQTNKLDIKNTDAYRYSQELSAYSYVFNQGFTNKESNNGKKIRLYSYYIYSYIAYEYDEEKVYKIVLSDCYVDADQYMNSALSN